MNLALNTASRISYNLSAIMRRAHHEARFALQLSKARGGTVAARRAIFASFLVKAWAAAKTEAAALAAHPACEALQKLLREASELLERQRDWRLPRGLRPRSRAGPRISRARGAQQTRALPPRLDRRGHAAPSDRR